MDDLKSWLEENNLGDYYQQLLNKEIKTPEDLTFFSRNDLAQMSTDFNMSLQTRKHFIKTAESLSIGAPPSYSPIEGQCFPILCPEHQKPVEILCLTDNQLVCYICIATTHYGHKGKTVAEAVEDEREGIYNAREMLKKKTQAVEGDISKMQKLRSMLSKRKMEVEQEIHTCFEQYRRVCNEREEKLIAEIKEMCKRKEDIISQHEIKLSSTLDQDNKLLLEADDIIKEQVGAHLLQLGRDLQKRLDVDQVQPVPNISVNIVFDEGPSLLDVIKIAGELKDVVTSPTHTTATGPGLNEAVLGEFSYFTIVTNDKNGRRRKNGGSAFHIECNHCNPEFSVVDNHDGTYAVSYKILLGDQKMKHELSILLGGKHISGSPYLISVAKAVNMTNVVAIEASEEYDARYQKENTLLDNDKIWHSKSNRPQYIIYSLGARCRLKRIMFSFAGGAPKYSPRDIEVHIADDLAGPWKVTERITRPNSMDSATIEFSCTTTFVKTLFQTNHGGGQMYLGSIKFM